MAMQIDPDTPWAVEPRQWQSEAFSTICEHYRQPNPEPGVVSAVMGSGKTELIAQICRAVQLEDGQLIAITTSKKKLVNDIAKTLNERGVACGRWFTDAKNLAETTAICVPSLRTFSAKLKNTSMRVALWIADEAHRTECSSILEPYKELQPDQSLGVTATAFRSDRWQYLTLFKRVLYRYGVADAIRDKVVVSWKIYNARKGGEIDDVCIQMARHADGAGICNAMDIADAESFADKLTVMGVPALAVHSGMETEEVDRRLGLLRDGEIKCVVHVNLLSEGVNFPWLCWMILRREVGARVRFVQEVGRLLRAHPGKEQAVFYDPHDLFGTFRLSYEEALGEPPKKPEWLGMAIEIKQAAGEISEADPPLAMAWIESVVRGLIVELDVRNLIDNRRIHTKVDRIKPGTDYQRAVLKTYIERSRVGDLAPSGWRACLQSIIERAELLRFGFAADLICALGAIHESGEWPDGI